MKKYKVLKVGEIKHSGDFIRIRTAQDFHTKIGTKLIDEFETPVSERDNEYYEYRRPIKTRSRTITKGFNRDAPKLRKCCCPIGRKCTWSREDGKYCTEMQS